MDFSRRATMGRATAVNDTAQFIDEITIIDVAVVGELRQFFIIIEIVLIVRRVALNFLRPIEETGDPLELRILCARADVIRAFAEVNFGEKGRPSLTLGSGSGVVVQLTEIADTRGLNDTTSPPAAPLHVGTGLLAELRGRLVRATGLRTSSAIVGPAAGPLTFVDTALRVCVRGVHHVLEELIVVKN
jgi:hypothetical protein